MSILKTVKGKLIAAKPFLQGLGIGLIAGPIIVLWTGWMVTGSAMRGKVQAALVNERGSICAARARAEVKDASKLDYKARRKLAEKWAVMPGQDEADSDVVWACSGELEKK
jgi:hypothetical protein